MSPLTLIEPDQAVSRTVQTAEYGKTLLTSFTVLAPHKLSGLSDDELQRYIRQVEYHSERALAELEKDEDYFGAVGWLARLNSARAAAYAEAGRRPQVWAAIEAVIDARDAGGIA
jgi:plasmid stabilization system protein ParE